MVLLVVTDRIIFSCGQNVILMLLKAVDFVVNVVVSLLVVIGHIIFSYGQ